VLGPFIYKFSSPQKQIFSLRPLVTTVNTPKKLQIYFLSPLGKYQKTKNYHKFKLVPLINKRWGSEKETQSSKYIEVFPFFGGKDEENDTFGGFFPIYGNLKNFFGKKEITFVLWPVYTKVKYSHYEATSYFWPFIRIVTSKKFPQKYKGAKVWPIFGKFKEGEVERSFVLWPFYIKETNKDPDFPSEKTIVFPFYAKEENPSYSRLILLWPFYQKVEGKESKYSQIDFPWPFYRKIEGKNIHGFRLWPLFGWKRTPKSKKSFVIWPLYFHNEIKIAKRQTLYLKKEDRFFLLSKVVQINKNGHPYLKEVRVWPIAYDLNKYAKNSEEFFMPAIFPFRDQGIEYNYSPLITLAEKKKNKNYSEIKFLWGLYRSEILPQERIDELAFLIRRVKGFNTDYIEFLEGLLGFGKIQGRSVCKLLFISLGEKK